jgi:hypothetical protein
MSAPTINYQDMKDDYKQLSMSFVDAEELGITLYSKWFFPSKENVGIIISRQIDYSQRETLYAMLDVKNETVTDVKVSDMIRWVQDKQLFRVPINELEVTHG